MNSAKVHLKQFKPTIKGLWKVWRETLFFGVLQSSYKVHESHCKEEATSFSFKKSSIQSKGGCCDANFGEDGPKKNWSESSG